MGATNRSFPLPNTGPARDVRPLVHFSAPRGWLNDPNGLVSFDGEHHLFYQHNPDAAAWGPMHWGHAVSDDLVAWNDLPTALSPDELGMIFSGSAVVDTNNAGGFGRDALVAAFTYHSEGGQSQAVAWSDDSGRTFTKFAGNPVIPSVAERPMCRDPKVFWYSRGPSGHWVMALSAGHEIWIYISNDLRTWNRTDTVTGFDLALGSLETPDLFELEADDGTTHWVVAVGASDGAPAGGSGTAVCIGDFDGERFDARTDPEWVDHGSDFYAAQSWNGVADGRRIWIAWMGNWPRDFSPRPDVPWRGQMSIPRELSLRAIDDGHYRLIQTPIRELDRYRSAGHDEASVVVGPRGYEPQVQGRALDIALDGIERHDGTLDIVCSRSGEHVVVTVELAESMISVTHPPRAADRIGTGNRRTRRTEITLNPDPIGLRILLDTSSIEVLCGATAISDLLEGDDAPWTLQVAAKPGELTIDHVRINPLEPPTRGG